MRHLIPISGKDSLATALFMSAHEPREYEFFYNDNGAELPETYAWLKSIEEKKGWNIHRVGSDLHQIIKDNKFLPSGQRRFCTRQSKIEPMKKWIGKDEVTIYYGLRADEPERVGFKGAEKNIHARYPLRENNLKLSGVWSIVAASGMLPPSFEWVALRDKVLTNYPEPERGYDNFTPWQRHIIFSGRTRPNCYFCFYQRQYEYIWLYDTHPDLFKEACRLEDETGGEGYTWRDGYRLSELVDKRNAIIDRRVQEIGKLIFDKKQGLLFGDSGDNELGLTSCGLLCGK